MRSLPFLALLLLPLALVSCRGDDHDDDYGTTEVHGTRSGDGDSEGMGGGRGPGTQTAGGRAEDE